MKQLTTSARATKAQQQQQNIYKQQEHTLK